MQEIELNPVGSSPLTRGKRNVGALTELQARLIPAHAGKTRAGGSSVGEGRAHPRSRGENDFLPVSSRPRHGSSPLTRGKPSCIISMRVRIRLIPAHAGKTDPPIDCRSRRTAHPRSRGENSTSWSTPSGDLGSSPLTRGKPQEGGCSLSVLRLIPAHAGKTFIWSAPPLKTAAHPRSRGENEERIRSKMVESGSSPLTRGKHFLTCAFTAQIDQILETLELAASFGSYLIWVACATDAPQDPVRSIGLVLPSSRGAS